jgi:small subunit ribosomal protein S20
LANHKSAIKRIRQNEKRRERNASRKTRVKTMVKGLMANIEAKDPVKALEQFRATQKLIDQTAAKGTFHWRTAARKISRLHKRLKALTDNTVTVQ